MAVLSKDVFVYHKVYGVIRADMNIRTRRNVKKFLEGLSSGSSSSLKKCRHDKEQCQRAGQACRRPYPRRPKCCRWRRHPARIISGNMPKIIVSEVIKIGRSRALAADMAAAAIPMPCCRRSEGVLRKQNGRLASRPISMISPVCI